MLQHKMSTVTPLSSNRARYKQINIKHTCFSTFTVRTYNTISMLRQKSQPLRHKTTKLRHKMFTPLSILTHPLVFNSINFYLCSLALCLYTCWRYKKWFLQIEQAYGRMSLWPFMCSFQYFFR